jgi:hypothetical protein
MFANELKESVIWALSANLVPMILGSPGVGKSDITNGIANEFKLLPIDLRLSQCDQTDLLGFPMHDNKRMDYVPPKHFPLQGLDEIPKGYNGWLLFLDEFPSAPLAVQAAAYRLVLDRKVGEYSIHKKCVIVCAGNKEDDGGIVNRLSTPMQSRLVHLELDVSAEEWVKWANKANLDHRVISYIEGCPDHLHQFDPNHNDKTFACPRTWEFASKLIKGKDPTALMLKVLTGTLSAGIAHQFFSYMNYCSELPSLKDILAQPDDINIPEDPALLYATSYMVAAYLNGNNADRLMRYIDRLSVDFSVTAIRSALSKDKTLLEIDAVRDWAHKLADEVF